MTFAPKFPWFFRRFHRGVPDKHILFWKSDTQVDRQRFGVDVDATEEPILSMIASPKSSAGWLTSKRFVWNGAEGQQQFRLDQINDVELKIMDRPEVPSDNPDLYELALRITLADGRHYDIRMPETARQNRWLRRKF